ncbi:MAG: hypothetical protein ACI4SG_02100 [Oligosphaeraceae bacterium]
MDAQWIWLDPRLHPHRQATRLRTYFDLPLPQGQRYTVAQFQRTVPLAKPLRQVRLLVSGDTTYHLSLNGRHLVAGPANFGGDWLDTPGILPWYGEICLWEADGADALHFDALVSLGPVLLCDISRGQGGFYLQAELLYQDGTREWLLSDSSWQARALPAHVDDSTYDGSLPPSPWAPAVPIPLPRPVVPSPLPPRQETRIYPAGEQSLWIPPGEQRDFVVEFSRIHCGYPTLQADGACHVELQCFEDTPSHPHDHLDVRLAEPGGEYRALHTHSVGGYLLTVRNQEANRGLTLVPGMVETCLPTPVEGEFRCSDPELEAVYQVCRWTLRICRQNLHLDSPKHQEPLACTGDYYIETLMTLGTYGDMRLAEFDLLRTARILEANDGRLFHTSYSLIWVQWLRDVHLFTGNLSLVRQCLPALRLLLKRFRTYMGTEGVLDNPPDYMFVDWLVVDGFSLHHPPKYLGQTVLNAFLHGALENAAALFSLLGLPQEAREAREWAASLSRACRALLYDPEKQLYLDGQGTPSPTTAYYLPENLDRRHYSRHANILAVLYGLVEGEEARALLRRVLESDLPEVQPYFMHYTLEALEKTGLFSTYGMDLLRKWIPLARECPKGLKEGWFPPQPDYAFDFSHAWGGTPAYQLPVRLLGLELLEPAFRKIRLTPRLLGLDWAEIRLPTPHGMLTCSLKKGEPPRYHIPPEICALLSQDPLD